LENPSLILAPEFQSTFAVHFRNPMIVKVGPFADQVAFATDLQNVGGVCD